MKNYHLTGLLVLISFTAISQQIPEHLKEEFSKNKITFTDNKGQVTDQNGQPRPDVLYSGKSGNLAFYLRNNGVSYQLYKWQDQEGDYDQGSQRRKREYKKIGVYRIDMEWQGINDHVTIMGSNLVPGVENFYNTLDPDGVTGVRSYNNVRYSDLYEGIDLLWYVSKDGHLEYDFIIDPGEDYRRINWSIKGAEDLYVSESGELIIETPYGTIKEQPPVAYQGQHIIDAAWKVEKDVIGFTIDEYDALQPLVIDPIVRLWGTYNGGGGSEFCGEIGLDAAGNIYMGGNTQSFSNIATIGAHKTFLSGTSDGMLVKFDNNGVRLWGTYFGGNSYETVLGLGLDASNHIYLTGESASTSGIATAGSHQATLNGIDAYLIKFDNNGVRLWGTYYGGSSIDYGYKCRVAPAGQVYLTGTATSNNAIATPGSFQDTHGGNDDAFIVQFDANGNRQWASYFGGIFHDEGLSLVTDATHVYLLGSTESTSGIATAGSHQSTFGGDVDGMIVKMDHNGNRVWSTYYGGSGFEQIQDGLLDGTNLYLVGHSSSSTNISTVGSYQAVRGGGYDAMLIKMTTGGVRQWATYFGGPDTDFGYSIAQDVSSNIYISGNTKSNTGIATPDAYKSTLGLPRDAFVATFESNGAGIWATYYGGSFFEDSRSCQVDAAGYIYLSGQTLSTDLISTPGSQQEIFGGTSDAFLVKFRPCQPSAITMAVDACDTYTSPSGKYTWTSSGSYNDTLVNIEGCDSVLTINLSLTATPSISSTTPGDTCDFGTVTLQATVTAGLLNWYATPTGGTMLGSGGSFVTPPLAATSTFYVEASKNGCASGRSPVMAQVYETPKITAISSGIAVCGSGNIMLGASTNFGVMEWYDVPGGGSPLGIGPNFTTPIILATRSYFVQTTANGCVSPRTVVIAEVKQPSYSFLDETACFEYTNPSGTRKHNLSGVYHDTIPNAVGCDSLITINLTVNTVDTGAVLNGSTYTANASEGNYQWLDCDSGLIPVDGEIERSFQPSKNGSYAVIVTNNGCIDTSACISIGYVGVGEKSGDAGIAVFPNPTNRMVNILLDKFYDQVNISLIDAAGREVRSWSFREVQKTELDIQSPAGVYVIRILIADQMYMRELVKY